MNWKRQLRALNWDAVGGFIAAFLAVILHLLRFIDEAVLLAIMTSLLALLFFRDLREETAEEELTESVTNTEQRVAEIRARQSGPVRVWSSVLTVLAVLDLPNTVGT